MTMTPEEAHEQIGEAKLRSDTLEALVELLNLFGQYIKADSGSDLEKDLESTIETVTREIADQGADGLAGHIILAACAIIFDLAPYEGVQEWLVVQSREIQRLVDEAHDAHSH